MNVFHKLLSRTVGTLAAFLLFCAGVAQAQWTPVMPVPATGDYWGFTADYHDGKIYTFGGITNSSTTLSNATYIYNVAANTWQAGANMLQGRYQHMSAVLNGKIYQIGGLVGPSNQVASYTNTVTSYDPVGNNFSQETAMPRSAYSGAAVAVDGKIFVLGGQFLQGTTLYYTGNALVYSNGTWTEVQGGAPYVGANQAATVIGNTIYLSSGVEVVNNQLVYANKAFKGTVSGTSITWTPIAAPPSLMNGAVMGQLDGKPFIAAGASNSDDFRGAYVYDDATNTWTAFYQLPSQRTGARMAGDGTTPYLIGGEGTTEVLKAESGEAVPVASIGEVNFHIAMRPGDQRNLNIPVANLGVASLSAELSIQGTPWVTGNSITVNPSQAGTLVASVNATGLADGRYEVTGTITTNDANNTDVPVNIDVWVSSDLIVKPTTVVLEEAHGTWCPPCGTAGIPAVENLESTYGERVIVLSYHDKGGNRYDPFSITQGESLNNMLELNAYPTGAIMRWTWDGSKQLGANVWAAAAAQVFATQPNAMAAVEVDSYSYDPQTREVDAMVTITTATPIAWGGNASLRLTAIVTEDGYEYKQAYSDKPEAVIEHENVTRHFWPNNMGQALNAPAGSTVDNNSLMKPGTSITVPVKFTVPEFTTPTSSGDLSSVPVTPENCHIVFLVHVNNGSALGPILGAHKQELTEGSVSGPSIAVDWGTTSKEFLSGESATYSFMITNNRSEPAQITINRAAQNLPNGWTSEICTGPNDCDDAGNVVYTIPGDGTHTFYLKITSAASEVGENGTVRLVVQGPGDFVADQTYAASTRTSSVAVPGEVGGLSMRSITPNPASSVARIDVSIPVGSQTTLEIFTIGGEKVATLFEGRLEAGMRQIDADVSALESGKYLLVLKSGE